MNSLESPAFAEPRRWFQRRVGDGLAPTPAPVLGWLEQAGLGLLACDADGRVLMATEGAARLLGRPIADLTGRRLADWCVDPAEAHDLAAPGLHRCSLRDGRGRRWRAGLLVADLNDGPVRRTVVLQDLALSAVTPERPPRDTPAATIDPLTGLYDRSAFRLRLADAMASARQHGVALALMFLDLDDFKRVNDSLGHGAGDQLLRHVARTLGHTLGGDPITVARIGGDEFTVIVPDMRSAEDAALVAQRVLDAFEAPFRLAGTEVQVSTSIGISLHAGEHDDVDLLLRHTDMAMYRSKARGRGTYSFFSPEMGAEAAARLRLEGDLRRAMERGEFVLHYQPKAELATGRVTGVEALLRWRCPGRGLVPPDRFIPVLEDSRLILPVGAWVLRTACADLAAWDRAGLRPLRMAVNLSPRQFAQPFLARAVEDTLLEHGLAGDRLELELTESLLLDDRLGTSEVLEAFARMGVQVAIDDFGTGHSSLSRLKRLDVDTLKIDRSFVAELPHDRNDLAIAAAIVAMGRSLDMRVVAEGVETEDQAECLASLGCHEVQGWLLGRPMPAAAFVDWLRERESARPRSRACSDTVPMTLMSLDTLDEV
jgi:diguanylate cyclase (GGDEF)-like protein